MQRNSLSFAISTHHACLQRSYHEHLFKDAVTKMTRANIKSSLELEKFVNLGKKVAAISAGNFQDELDLSDAPDHFKGMVHRLGSCGCWVC